MGQPPTSAGAAERSHGVRQGVREALSFAASVGPATGLFIGVVTGLAVVSRDGLLQAGLFRLAHEEIAVRGAQCAVALPILIAAGLIFGQLWVRASSRSTGSRIFIRVILAGIAINLATTTLLGWRWLFPYGLLPTATVALLLATPRLAGWLSNDGSQAAGHLAIATPIVVVLAVERSAIVVPGLGDITRPLATLAIAVALVATTIGLRRDAAPAFPVRLPRIGVLGFVATLALYLSFALRTPPDTAGPHVVLITVDTLRADHLSTYGYPRATSPNLSRLAEEGSLFLQAVVQRPKTSPSIASMMTGTFPHDHGVRQTMTRLPSHLATLAELLRNAGYETIGVVANPNVGRTYAFDQGFGSFHEDWSSSPDRQARARKNQIDVDEDDFIAATSIASLREKANGRPLFLWAHFIAPHAPYKPPEPFDEMFVGDSWDDQQSPVSLASGDNQLEQDGFGTIPPEALLQRRDGSGDAERRHGYYVAQYDATIRYFDEKLGEIMDVLDELGLAEETLLIVTSDHGESLGDHNYYYEHGMLPYDSTARVPLVVRLPGVAISGQVVQSPVSIVDIMPTVLDIAGLPRQESLRGASLLPFLRGVRYRSESLAFTESGYGSEPQFAVRDERWKLIYVPSPSDREIMQGSRYELYDLWSDPGETRNRIEEHRDIAERLRREIVRWTEQAADSTREALPQTTPDKRSQERLRALGYID